MPDTIAHYRVVSKLGEGGMGVVYAAADERLHRRVAIKMVRGTVGIRSRASASGARRAPPPACRTPTSASCTRSARPNGELFIAMELLEGESLSARLARGPIPLAESVDITLAILSALDAIHARGLVHRDLKPSNIFLTPHGVKLLDFGLARAVQDASDQTRADITMAGTVMGTPHYMSPEQLTGDPLDARSDLFAVGAILFELLVGERGVPRQDHGAGLPRHHVRAAAVAGRLAGAGGGRPVIHRATAKRPATATPTPPRWRRSCAPALRLADSGETPAARTDDAADRAAVPDAPPDPEIDFLSFSLADAITASLGSLESLVVRSSLAAARFKADAPDLAALAVRAGRRRGRHRHAAARRRASARGDATRRGARAAGCSGRRRRRSRSTTSFSCRTISPARSSNRSRCRSPRASSGCSRTTRRRPPGPYEYYLRANELASDPKSWAIARDLYQQAVRGRSALCAGLGAARTRASADRQARRRHRRGPGACRGRAGSARSS